MVHLFPMTEEEYDAFMKVPRQGFIDDQVQAGHWRADEAEKNMQMLPGGQATPDHFFFSIKDGDAGNNVGGLWCFYHQASLQRIGVGEWTIRDITLAGGE
jgi:hypothetical protein